MRQFLANSLFEIAVRARKSPWIETISPVLYCQLVPSGLVRARGLKRNVMKTQVDLHVRARKSPWIETSVPLNRTHPGSSGLVRARGLKQLSSTWPV